MQPIRSYRHAFAWIAALVVVFASLAPSVSRMLASVEQPSHHVSAHGVEHSDAHADHGQNGSEKGKNSHAGHGIGPHCPFCNIQFHAVIPTAPGEPLLYRTGSAISILPPSLELPADSFLLVTLQARGPPASA